MAIVILGRTGCSLCDVALSDMDDVVMFPAFVSDSTHPLWRFSDSAMHRSCFTSWSEAGTFRALFDDVWLREVPHHPRRMLEDGTIVDLHAPE